MMIKLKTVKKDYKKIIETLEQEIVRKQKIIDTLRDENKVLLKTALKSQEKLKKLNK